MRKFSLFTISVVTCLSLLSQTTTPVKGAPCDPLPLGQMSSNLQEGQPILIRFIPSSLSAPADAYSLSLEKDGEQIAAPSFFDDGRSYKITFDSLAQGTYQWSLSQTGRGSCSSGSFTIAERTPPPTSGSTDFPGILELINDPLPEGKFTSLGQITSQLIPLILILAGMFATVLLIWGGIKYITARGDPKAVEGARGTITSAIIGLAILASIFVIATILQLVFKIKILSSIASPVYARGVDIGCEFKFAGQCAKYIFPTFGSLFTSIINFALAAGGLLFFIIILWGGIRYMLSRGDEKQLMDARQTLSNGVIGILIIVSVFAIIKLIELATGANISII